MCDVILVECGPLARDLICLFLNSVEPSCPPLLQTSLVILHQESTVATIAWCWVSLYLFKGN